MHQMDICVICNLDDDKPTTCLREKGSKGINEAAQKRGDVLETAAGQFVHPKCRQSYLNPFNIAKAASVEQDGCSSADCQPILRSKAQFDFATNCLFCGQVAKKDKKRSANIYFVRSMDFQTHILEICKERNDSWAVDVLGRIGSVNDLHAADALYHQVCSINFRTKKQVPLLFSIPNEVPLKNGPGRPPSADDHFKTIVSFLENNPTEQVTVKDLVSKMKDLCGDLAYTPKFMVKRLKEHFREDVIIFERQGTAGVVTLRKAANSILKEFYQRPKTSIEDDKIAVITCAAKLIKSEILSLEPEKEYYPSTESIASHEENLQYVPEGLRTLLHSLIFDSKSDLKLSSIGQSIMQATRPRSFLPPLQLGLAVQLHHSFGSRSLIELLYSLGFCSSYNEVQKFESSAALAQGISIPGIRSDSSLQFVADNVDHDINTLDGTGTFHGMGIVATVTPSSTFNNRIKRIRATSDDLRAVGKIKINYYNAPTNNFMEMMYRPLDECTVVDESKRLDMLMNILWPLKCPTPGWSGIWQMTSKGSYPGKTTVVFLPMIDLSPSDPTCIFSTMQFVSDQASRYGFTPILTFDQPLFWKAIRIRENEQDDSQLRNIVLRLGGFHMCMSYLGAIGQIMHGSGLREVLALVYAPNTVPSILNGKAISRSIRAHILMDTSLYSLIVSKLKENVQNSQGEETESYLCDTSILSEYERLLDGEDMVQTICQNDKVAGLCAEVYNFIEDLVQSGRTAALWRQYLEMIEILKTFIKSERTGNWKLHLATVYRMLPFFAAAGHNLYAKSSYIYLMDMERLPEEHPDVFEKFMDGHHVMRRADRHWAGLSSDHVIEQVLMRSVKSCGGLTRGRGMTETQRVQWVLSMPACAEINSAMNDVTGTGYVTSEQHKEAGVTRMERDRKDILSIVSFLRERDPFQQNPNLRNIETGVTADSNVNADNAKNVGQRIIDSMVGQNIMKYSFKRSLQVIPMNVKNHIKVGDDHIQIDPQLLFQRLATAANGMGEDLAVVLSYELSSMPPSLFDANGVMREAQKSSLAEHIWSLGDCQAHPSAGNSKYVVDGGCLLHRIPWLKGETFGQICGRYTGYLRRRYHFSVVVFDSYSDQPSTKDMTHLRRSRGLYATEVFFDAETPFKTSKDIFLTNDANKQRFIHLLARALERDGFEVLHAEGDADLPIVQKAVSMSSHDDVTVVGSDTDLLVLLCHYFDPSCHNIYFGDDSKQGSASKIWDVRKTTQVLGEDLTHVLPAIHSLTGCDTTSRMFGIGKSNSVKKFLTSSHCRESIKVFADISSEKNTVINSGCEVISCLYGGLPNEGLDLLRYRKFGTKLAAGSIAIQCQNLPPTSDAATFHVLRAYHQVYYWMTSATLPPTDWGWQVSDGKLLPIKTSKSAAPPTLLKIVRCHCKSNCDSRRCSCRKNGLECTISCAECHGNCSNSVDVDLNDD